MNIDTLIERLQELKRHPATPTENVGKYTVLAWDADSGQHEAVSGYVIDPKNGTLELTTDDDSYEINLGL
jgi:hypothetical protein